MTTTGATTAESATSDRRTPLTRQERRKERLAAMSDKERIKLARLTPENRAKFLDLLLDREDSTRKMREVLYADSRQQRIDEDHVKKLLGGVVLAKLKRDPKFFAEHLTAESIPEHERYLIHRYWPALWPEAVKPARRAKPQPTANGVTKE